MDQSKLKGKRIALMGGAGFIGHNLALELKRLGAHPHVVDGLQVNNLGYYTSGYGDNPRSELYIEFINERLRLLRESGVGLHVVDLRDYHVVSHVFSEIMPDVVIHLAAIAHANRSNKDPFSTFDHSLRTLENVLDASRSRGCHVIYLSSSMVYVCFGGRVATEDQVCNPLGIYGALKYGAEKLVIGYNQVFDLPYTIIRPSALYGPRCVSRRVGQAFIENAMSGRNLTINGTGEDAVDFTYIKDFVQGVIRAVVTPESRGEVFNLTYGQSRKLSDLAELVIKEFPGVQLTYNPRDNLMPERGTLSTTKAMSLLGYRPEYPIEQGFVEYIRWYQKFAESNRQFFDRS